MRKKLLAVGALLGVAFALYWFQPWKLVVDRQVDERLPAATSATAGPTAAPTASATPAAKVDTVLRAGTFISHEHETTGAAELVELADGRRVLALRGLDTSNGPDLYVWLSDGAANITDLKTTNYLDLGKLKGNRGNQVYEIPAGADLAQYKSVTIWCKRFSASFGAADLA